MASGDLSLTSNSSQEGSHEFNCYQNDRQRKMSNDSPKTYEAMKQLYDQAMIELNTLRTLQSDGKMQMDRVMEQLEYYRNQYRSAMDQVSQTSLESSNLCTKYTDVSNENVRLQQRIHHLEKKLSRQEKENGNSAHAFAEQYNDLKKKLENNRMEYDKLSKETDVCKKVCSDLSRDRSSLTLEKDDLKQQLANTIAQLDVALRDNAGWREKCDKLVQQHENNIKEMTQVLQARADELRRVTSQRNSAEHELRITMNERKGVLEENQKLSDDLTAAKDDLEKSYGSNKSMMYENDGLKREIDAMLRQRDSLINECGNMREKLDEVNNKLEKMEGRENWGKSMDSKDHFCYNDQHSLDLDAANKEAEKLRKSLERARAEIEKAAQETEVAKSSRDLAISEREKIVQERDSVKSLCDELRKERDKAISDRLAEIRDSEKIKKQKDEACREIEQLREQMESQLSVSRRNIRWSYMPYDMDQNAKFDREFVELDMSDAQQNDDLGIVLEGGRESSPNRIDCGIVVVDVANHSAAAGKLRVNDCIMQVNNLDCTSVTKRIVIEAIRNGGPHCVVTVKRQRLSMAHMYAVQLSANDSRPHGICLEIGVFISKIGSNSQAAKENELAAGDRVLSINNKTMEGITLAKDAMLYLDDPRNDNISIIALKQITQTSDSANSARNKLNRMINTCTQTIEQSINVDGDSNRHISSNNSKSTSKISEMINKFRGKIHMQKGSTASESDSLCQEHDAIAVLDSVLNNENSSNSGKSKDNLFKRSKRTKKESTKEANKNLGTWPRANLINTTTTHDNHTGTIVQHRKKERPALSLFTGPISLGKEEKSQTAKKSNYFTAHMHEPTPSCISKPIMSNGSSGSTNSGSNRNSNPIPFHVIYPPSASTLHRHSVYSALEVEPIMLESSKALPSKGSEKHYQHHYPYHQMHHSNPVNSNRYSLNFSPTSSSDNSHTYNNTIMRKSPTINMDAKFPLQQSTIDYALKNSADSFLHSKSPMSSLDFKPNSSQHYQYQPQQQDLISLKSQNSIDSFLSPKSPPSMEMPTKPSMRDTTDLYMTRRLSKNVSKYPSDSDSLGMESISSPNNTLPSSCSVLRASQVASSGNANSTRTQRLFPNIPSHLHSSVHSNRQTSPLTTPITQSFDMGGGSLADKLEYDFNIPTHHSHGASMDIETYGRGNKVHPIRDRDIIYGSYGQAYEGGTFPRKKENQRFRVPSNPSVTSKGSDVKNSTGSIEHHSSEHGSPMPPSYKVEILSHGVNKRNSMPDYSPTPGDLRRVTIDKSTEPLGITIQCNNNGGGIFVSTVKSNSIASQVGLQIGDQLLEVCGINMRDANYTIASKILRQCGDAITMLVQYCPEKYDGNIVQHVIEEDSVSRSGSPTPRNSPRSMTRSLIMSTPSSLSSSQQPQSVPLAVPKRSVMPSPLKGQQFSDSLENQSDCSQTGLPDCIYDEEEPRIITLHTKKSINLGISLLGGNAVGIYVHDVQKNSLADVAGLKKGDHILEYNGVNLRCVTAEQAANEISKPADKVVIVLQYNLTKFNQIKDESGDSFYVRAGFDRPGILNTDDLPFIKDEILYVDTTIFRGVFGQWRAWKLDKYGHRLNCGIIPSQMKVEEEQRLLGDITDVDGNTRRGSTSARRSFFRRKKHQRSSSRDSKELASFSNTQLSWFSDSGMLSEEGPITSYQRVEKFNQESICRPVLVLGPLSECVVDRLSIDFPQFFQRCIMTPMNCSQDAMEKGLQSNIFIDYRRRGSIYECTTVQAIREMCDKNRHCILDVCISAVERLHRLQIYPIVLLLHFKSAKQIKEIKDSRYSTDKLSAKAAKEMYEHALKLESDYRQYISAVISAGANITHMSTQIKVAVDEEQSKAIWVPV